MAGRFQFVYDGTSWIVRWPKAVLLFWIILSLILAPFAPALLTQTTISFEPPKGTPSYAAKDVVYEYFPDLVDQAQFVGMIRDTGAEVSKLPGLGEFADNFGAAVNSSGKVNMFMPSGGVISLFQNNNLKLPGLISEDDDAMLFIWAINANPTSNEMQDFALWSHELFLDQVTNWTSSYGLEDRLNFKATLSMGEVVAVAIDTVKEDFERIDIISMPLAILTLYFVVGSGRLLLVTGCGLLVSTVVSTGVLALIGRIATMEAITPVLVMSLLVALSVDYSLFILTRFCEESVALHCGRVGRENLAKDVDQDTFREAICTTMATSGATIIISGTILVVAFVFLACFPVNIIANMGLGCAFSLLIMMAVNLTFVPALMSFFYSFFSKSISPNRLGARAWRCFANSSVRRALRVGSQANLADATERSSWHGVAKRSAEWPTNVIILGIALAGTAAFAWPVFDLRTTVDLKQNVPIGSDMYTLMDTLSDEFGGGSTNPYNVLMLPRDRVTPIFSDKFFKDSHHLWDSVITELNAEIPSGNGTGYFFMTYLRAPGAPTVSIDYKTMGTWCQLPGFPKNPVRPRPAECQTINMFTNIDDYQDNTTAPTATWGLVTPGMDPFSVDGDAFLKKLRSLLEIQGPLNNIDVYIVGPAAYGIDMVDGVYNFFPLMITATLITAGLFVGITFRSVVMPIRAISTSLLSVGFTYGIAIMIYEYGALNFLGIGNLSNNLKAIPWIIPCIVFFILTGLGLDYDIFLCVRITELRAQGMEPTEAIKSGFVATIGTISSAGVVMMFTFGAMVFSSLLNNVVMSLMMVVAVLYISIIAPIVVNPNIMALLGYWNWWPGVNSRPDSKDLGMSLQPQQSAA
jgi:uncharacterized membrane protein YdfJ with MMPL/SSD domain